MESDMHQVAELLKKEQNNPEAILEYSIYTFETKKDIPKAFQMLLNLLGTVKETNAIFKNIKYYMARVIKQADPIDIILELPFWKELTNNQNAAIYAWLGLIVKEYGGISQSILLLKKAISLFPNNHAFINNLVHVLEVDLKYTEALELSLKMFNETLPDFVFDIDTGKLASTGNSVTKITDKDLDLLSLIFNVIKILFIQGKLSHLKEWYDRVGSLLARSFSLTENFDYLSEYYKFIKELLKFLPLDKYEDNRKACKPLYIIGDSNCLSVAYHNIDLNSEQRIFMPLLTHNLKISHLRDENEHYAKYNYFNTVNSLRDEVIDSICFILGSCDVKDAFDALIEKSKSETELINILTETYLQRLKELSIFLRCCKVIVCPVLPMVDQYRDKYVLFNNELKKRIGNEKNSNLIYIGGFENELSSNKLKYYLDGLHSNPIWLSLVPYWSSNKN
jgi:hypothetical protein